MTEHEVGIGLATVCSDHVEGMAAYLSEPPPAPETMVVSIDQLEQVRESLGPDVWELQAAS